MKNVIKKWLVHIVLLPSASRLVRGDTDEEREGMVGAGWGGVAWRTDERGTR